MRAVEKAMRADFKAQREAKGSRQGKIVLVQHRDISDPETGGCYTIKRYQSEKSSDGAGGWLHERITLLPHSTAPGFEPIVLCPDDGEAVSVIAEWVAVIG